ncbi:MAG: beta-glucuronidase, partial [Planctomycetota bacterium]|nr:beta-glucuronidase [Planctomycetota bacterium]
MKNWSSLRKLHRRYRSVLFLLLLVTVTATAAAIPRPEHPRPQFHRDAWLNLNGQWNFAFDFDVVGVERGWAKDPSRFDKKIAVPFCPESELSGITYKAFIPAVWYHRTFSVPDDWDGMRIFLHFGAVDYDCRAWINGAAIGRHYGGSSSFSFEITAALRTGENDLVVCALDDVRGDVQPAGKQSRRLESRGVVYTRTTGIWQTVWLEARPQSFIESVRVVPDLDNSRFVVTPVINNYRRDMEFQATLFNAKKK